MGTHLQSLKSNLQKKGNNTLAYYCRQDGKRTKGTKNVLPGDAQAPELQGDSVQEGQGVAVLPGSSTLQPKAIRLWWSDQADLPQEGKDQEDRPEDGNHLRQGQEEVRHHEADQAMQVLRARRWQAKEGPDDPVLSMFT